MISFLFFIKININRNHENKFLLYIIIFFLKKKLIRDSELVNFLISDKKARFRTF